MKQLVIRKVLYENNQYIAIMDKSIADLGNAEKILYSNLLNKYELFCNDVIHGNIIGIETSDVTFNADVIKEDVFKIPTVNDYIKLGIILRHNNIRFNKKKNKIEKRSNL